MASNHERRSFGAKGGLDFIDVISSHKDHHVINGAGRWIDPSTGETKDIALGFHLTAFRRAVFDTIGDFDTNFNNYSLDDTDLNIRIKKGMPDCRRDTYSVDMEHVSTAHSVQLAHIKGCAHAPRNEYLKRKWGRDSSEWYVDEYDHPFNLQDKPLSYYPYHNDPLSIHQVEFKNNWKFED